MRSITSLVLLNTLAACGNSISFATEPPVVVGEFLQEIALHRERQQGLPSPDVLWILSDEDGAIVVKTDRGFANWSSGAWQACGPIQRGAPLGLPRNLEIRQRATDNTGRRAAATDRGLFECIGSGDWRQLRVDDELGRLWAQADVRGVTYDSMGQLWFATLAGVGARQENGKWKFFEGRDGLPFNDFSCVAAGSDGSVWFGTTRGVIRFHDGKWSYRQGKRWLPNDDVRSIHVDAKNQAWVATAGGAGCIVRRPMTLAAKARNYEQEIEHYIKRTPYGYVNASRLASPGDKRQIQHQDSDNDGLWTAMYGASQCFAYAVTRSDAARKRAHQAFEALRFLQTVTQGGEHSPPLGYVARTVVPTNGRDPNRGRLEHDRQFRATRDRLWKVYEPRWPLSADRTWYWKSDTSSDELDGHYFFHALYFDLVAESTDEKNRVREVIRQLTDHLIEHDFVLMDHDGKPTRWAVFRPDSLNHDIDWVQERGLNSLSMLSYLAVAHHVTGDRRYQEVSRSIGARSHLQVQRHGTENPAWNGFGKPVG